MKTSPLDIAVVDYGAGNLRSVLSALRELDCSARVAESSADLASADAVILPGVGAAADTMQNLVTRGLADAIREWTAADRPFLGICMGLQVLFQDSTEGRGQSCLGVLKGRVVRLPPGEKVPHMGWNQVHFAPEQTIFEGIPAGSNFYFVHSYIAEPADRGIVAAETDYGVRFCSAVRRGNLVATQFHPEKSGGIGLRLYRNFLTMARQ